jgi:uncharacterized protein
VVKGRALYDGGVRTDLLDILVCPLCKAELTLATTSEADGEILEGTLTCTGCGEAFPIEDGIPNMLPPDLREA